VVGQNTSEPVLVDDDDDEPLGLAQHLDGRVTCLTCGRIFSNAQNGKRHYATAHQTLPQSKCRICKKLYKNNLAMKQHMRSIHGITSSMMKTRILVPEQQTNPPPEYPDEQYNY
jgi:uncharacterized C2H2 Zn-finger protein